MSNKITASVTGYADFVCFCNQLCFAGVQANTIWPFSLYGAIKSPPTAIKIYFCENKHPFNL